MSRTWTGTLAPQPAASLPVSVPEATAPRPPGSQSGASQSGASQPEASQPGSTKPEGESPAEGAVPDLSGRLIAMARMIQVGAARSGRDGFDGKLLADAEAILARAGERMRLSASHTVAVLAGGTGSGKSSLFNKIAGADFSAVGVTRPVTQDAHACVWGEAGAGPLLEWLGVPRRNRYDRASALDTGESDLAGLALLDLPDHDSVMSHAHGLVDRLVEQADMMVWVLDPQKYADAAVHRRFLVPLAGHSDVLAVVLNQSDLLDDGQVEDCLADLRRLLESENLQDVPILVTSALTGAGLDDLRKLLADAVDARRAAAARISADLDREVRRFASYAGDVKTTPEGLTDARAGRLAQEFGQAAGIQAVGETLRGARELRAADFTGWPVAWAMQRLTGRDPLRKVKLGQLWQELRSVAAGPAQAQQAEIDNSLTEMAEEIAAPLPSPWSRTVRAAVRSKSEELPSALGTAISDSLPAQSSVAPWWRVADAFQGVLVGADIVGLAWLVAIIVGGVFGAASGVRGPLHTLIGNAALWPFAAGAVVVGLALGWLTERACRRWTAIGAERDRLRADTAIRDRIRGVVADLVGAPAEQELAELARFRQEYQIAAGGWLDAEPSSAQDADAGAAEAEAEQVEAAEVEAARA